MFTKLDKKNNLGFTLVEIMVVIVIAGLLASIAIPVTIAQQTAAIEAQQQADIANVAANIETLITQYNGLPPKQVNINTSNAGLWTATPLGDATILSGEVSTGNRVTGTLWVDGSYCLNATSTSGSKYMYRSDVDKIEETTSACPTTALGTIGTLPSGVNLNLPVAPSGLIASSPATGIITASWTAVNGATSYTVKIPGVEPVNTTSTTATIGGVPPGANTVTVYAQNTEGAGTSAVANVQVIGGQISDTLPAGSIITTSQNTIPPGWELADGREVSRTTYSTLFSQIGTKYGAGDGSTTFNLPNLKGRVIIGEDPSQAEFSASGMTGGTKTHTLGTSDMPEHNHGIVINDPGHNHTQNPHTHTQNAHGHGARVGVSGADDNNHTGNGDFVIDSDAGYKGVRGVTVDANTATNQNTTATNNASTTGMTVSLSNTGSGQAYDKMQPYFVMRYLIKTNASVNPANTELAQRLSAAEAKLYGVTQAVDVNHTFTWDQITDAPSNYDMTSIGGIVQTAGDTIPVGWLLADGSAVSRTTYASLFAAIGTTYGVGDGSTTFNLPNLKGRTPVGFDSSQAEYNFLGETGGSKTHTLSTENLPSHNHTGSVNTDGNHNHSQDAHSHGLTIPFYPTSWENGNYGLPVSGGFGGRVAVTGGWGIGTDGRQPYIYPNGSHSHTFTTASTGSNEAFGILDSYMTLNYMIKYTNATSSDTVFDNRLVGEENKTSTITSNVSTLQTQMSTHTHTWSSISNIPARLGPTSQTVTDWNTAVETGAYVSTNAANAPTTGAGVTYMGTVQSVGGNYIQQTVHEYSTDSSANTKTYRRDANDVSGSRVWSPWYRVFQSETEIKEVIAATPGGGGGDSMPAGSIVQIANTTAIPAGWELADGRTVSRDTYRTLFNAIGETYGSGDGSTTFKLPDMRGKVVVGQDTGQTEFDVMGETGGVKTHVLTTNEMPSHTHIQDAHTHIQNAHQHEIWVGSAKLNYSTFGAGAGSSGGMFTCCGGSEDVRAYSTTATNQNTTATNQNAGGGAAHNNLAPYIVLRYIIKTTATGPTDPALIARVAAEETQMDATAPIDNPVFSGDVLASSQVSFFVEGTSAYHPGQAWLDRGLWPNSSGTSTANATYNTGNAWNSSNGAFTAPQDGIYYFFAGGWSNHNGYGNRYAYAFYVNGVKKQISGGSTSAGDTPMTTSSIALKLNSGDVVRLYMWTTVAQNLGTTTNPMYWGGYLLG